MFIYINATNRCNFRCGFCHLSNDERNDPKMIDLDVLNTRLTEIQYEDWFGVYLTGGEVGMLTDAQWQGLTDTIRAHTSLPLIVYTNFSRVPKGFYAPDVHLSVGFDFDHRQNASCVRKNLAAYKKTFSMRITLTEKMLKLTPCFLISELKLYEHLSYVHLMRDPTVDLAEYLEGVVKWQKAAVEQRCNFNVYERHEFHASPTYVIGVDGAATYVAPLESLMTA